MGDMLVYNNSPPTLSGVGHQRTVSTSAACNQWLSLAKTLLKVALAGTNRSLVTRTSKCEWAITPSLSPLHIVISPLGKHVKVMFPQNLEEPCLHKWKEDDWWVCTRECTKKIRWQLDWTSHIFKGLW